jgi:hypothetical protein
LHLIENNIGTFGLPLMGLQLRVMASLRGLALRLDVVAYSDGIYSVWDVESNGSTDIELAAIAG